MEEEHEDIDLRELIIIDSTGTFSKVWMIINIIVCITSAYFYTWLTAFGDHYDQSFMIVTCTLIETFFLITMTKKFITDYQIEGEGETKPTRDLFLIANRYLKGEFLLDALPLIPLQFIFGLDIKILYITKVIRIVNGFRVFNVTYIYDSVKQISKDKLDQRILEEPIIGEDKINDHNQIEFLLFFYNILKTAKLGFTILNLSYFLGMFWLIFSDIDRYYGELSHIS